jgi:hypothetical protein
VQRAYQLLSDQKGSHDRQRRVLRPSTAGRGEAPASEDARDLATCVARRLQHDETATPDLTGGLVDVRVQVKDTDAHLLARGLRDECAQTLGIQEP